MDSAQPPKSNSLPVKTILLILLGAAIAIWFILQGNQPQGIPRGSSSSPIANDISNHPLPGPSPAPGESVEKYPMLDSPDSVAADQEFPIQVSLTEQQQTPEVKIMNGAATPDGKLVLALPPTQDDSWKLDVVLSAPGLQFTRGNGHQQHRPAAAGRCHVRHLLRQSRATRSGSAA